MHLHSLLFYSHITGDVILLENAKQFYPSKYPLS